MALPAPKFNPTDQPKGKRSWHLDAKVYKRDKTSNQHTDQSFPGSSQLVSEASIEQSPVSGQPPDVAPGNQHQVERQWRELRRRYTPPIHQDMIRMTVSHESEEGGVESLGGLFTGPVADVPEGDTVITGNEQNIRNRLRSMVTDKRQKLAQLKEQAAKLETTVIHKLLRLRKIIRFIKVVSLIGTSFGDFLFSFSVMALVTTGEAAYALFNRNYKVIDFKDKFVIIDIVLLIWGLFLVAVFVVLVYIIVVLYQTISAAVQATGPGPLDPINALWLEGGGVTE